VQAVLSIVCGIFLVFVVACRHAHKHTQPFYGSMDFVRDNPSEPVPEETFTHSHLSWSSIVPYLLHPSATIHGILPVQSTHLTVFFHNLSPCFLWLPLGLTPSTSYFIHFFTQSHTQPFYCTSGICPGSPGWAGTRKAKPARLKPIWIYWSKR